MIGDLGRREFVSAIGVGAIAGCLDTSSPESVSFSPSDVDMVVEEAAPTPEWPVPVDVDPSALDPTFEQIEATIEPVPSTITTERIPNGVVRAEIVESRDEATAFQQRNADVSGDQVYHELREAPSARSNARFAAVAWDAIEADTAELLNSLEAEHETVHTRVEDRQAEITYQGQKEDLQRAALFAYQFESDLQRPIRTLQRWSADPTASVLDIASEARTLERADATVDVWNHLGSQYESSLDSPRDFTSMFESTIEAGLEDANEYPEMNENWVEAIGVDAVETQFQENLLLQLGHRIDSIRDGLDEALDSGMLGRGIADCLRFEVSSRILDIITERVENSEIANPQSIEAIQDERKETLDAATRAQDVVSGQPLGKYLFAESIAELESTDEQVRGKAERDSDRTSRLDREYTEYVVLQAELSGLPDAIERFEDRIENN